MEVNKIVKKTYVETLNKAGASMRSGARAATAHENEILKFAYNSLNIQIALNIMCCTGAETFEEYLEELESIKDRMTELEMKDHKDFMEYYFNEAKKLKEKGAQ